MSRYPVLTVVVASFLACCSLSARAADAVRYAVDDAAVRNSLPDSTLGIVEEEAIFTWTAYMSGLRGRSYIKFPLAGLPDSSLVTAAVLNLYQFDAGGFVPIVNVHHVADDAWTEATVTWNNRPLPTPGTANLIISKDIGFAAGWVSFDLLSGGVWDYDSDVSDGYVSLLIKSTEAGDERHIFHSDEAAAGLAYRPYLQITWIPEPASVALVGLAGLWLTCSRPQRPAVVA